MNEINIYIRITITILGLAFPILLQVIARLDEKYQSLEVVDIFNKEKSKKWFIIFLITSLISIGIWSFKFESIIRIDGLNYFIENSANLLVFTSSVGLVICFFFLVFKILTYYTPVKFVEYLISKIEKEKDSTIYFEALRDVFILNVKNQNDPFTNRIARYYYDLFQKFRNSNQDKPVEYPEVYYSLVYKTIEELGALKSKKNHSLEYRTAGGVWLLGESQSSGISESTYIWLWRNLLLGIQYDEERYITYLWESSHQYMQFSLPRIDAIYSIDHSAVTNQDETDSRNVQRSRFIEFHLAIGGLLLYEKKYKSLHKIFNYTTSQPVSYNLFPQSCDSILDWFVKFYDQYDTFFPWITQKYYFLDQSGLSSENIVKKWIRTYTALLFLRQYILPSNYNYSNPLDFRFTQDLNGKRNLLNSLSQLEHDVTELLENNELLKEIGLTIVDEKYCEKRGTKMPLDFLDDIKQRLINDIDDESNSLTIDNKKELQFYQSSKKSLDQILDQYYRLNNDLEDEKETKSWYVNGEKMVYNKEAFTNSSEVTYIDFDTFLGHRVSDKIHTGISSTFKFNTKKRYLIAFKDLEKAFNKLKLSADYIIIEFGNPLRSIREKANAEVLSFSSAIDLFNTCFILPKEHLPELRLNTPLGDENELYSLNKLEGEKNFYASVIDLNNVSTELSEKLPSNIEEVAKKVLLVLYLRLQIKWRTDANIVQISEYSEYRDENRSDSIETIEPM